MKKMKNPDLSLAISSNGKDVTVKDCTFFLQQKDKIKLANFIFDRLYGRYLKPFDYNSDDYRKHFKNGFALMANCCLLIETYVSFTSRQFRSTQNKSGKCFGYFFSSHKSFALLAKGALKPDGTIADKKDGGIPNDFFDNVRCGILHNGETKNGWKINREATSPYFDPGTKTLNAFEFSSLLKKILDNYRDTLISSDFDNDEIWINFKNRLNDLISKS